MVGEDVKLQGQLAYSILDPEFHMQGLVPYFHYASEKVDWLTWLPFPGNTPGKDGMLSTCEETLLVNISFKHLPHFTMNQSIAKF